MQDFLFYFFAALTVVCAALVILNRNPVNCAMFLVLSIASMAGLFVLLQAFFLAAVQVLVYAGAVMVLFLFVIMLLELKEEERRKIRTFGAVSGLIAVLVIGFVFRRSMQSVEPAASTGVDASVGATKPLGELLFNSYLLPFEIVSILLLVAMVGVILLSKKELK
jgi:NADH-quinone oxidoreductase subunit J